VPQLKRERSLRARFAEANGNYHNISNTWLVRGFPSSSPLTPATQSGLCGAFIPFTGFASSANPAQASLPRSNGGGGWDGDPFKILPDDTAALRRCCRAFAHTVDQGGSEQCGGEALAGALDTGMLNRQVKRPIFDR
jgi:hypothetical protein